MATTDSDGCRCKHPVPSEAIPAGVRCCQIALCCCGRTPSPADRVAQARQAIAAKREKAKAATEGPWRLSWYLGGEAAPETYIVAENDDVVAVCKSDQGEDGSRRYNGNAEFLLGQTPAHVLAVLDAAESVLDRRHADVSQWRGGRPRCDRCNTPYPCPDAAAVLDVYAGGSSPTTGATQ